MSIKVKKAPRFVEVQGSHANARTKSVDILFRAADDEQYAVEIDPAIIEALMFAIQGEAMRLRSILPEEDTAPRQDLRVKGMSAAMSEDGSIAWQIVLEGNLHVNLSFAASDFDELDRQMQDVRALLHQKRH